MEFELDLTYTQVKFLNGSDRAEFPTYILVDRGPITLDPSLLHWVDLGLGQLSSRWPKFWPKFWPILAYFGEVKISHSIYGVDWGPRTSRFRVKLLVLGPQSTISKATHCQK